MPNEEYKVCVSCKENKEFTFFSKKSSTKDGLQNVCKPCAKLHSRKHYLSNKEKVKKRTRDREEKVYCERQDYVASRLDVGCIDCGESDIVVLDFDHVNDKKESIANMLQKGLSLSTLEKEIDKCQVRCANCHRKKTANDFNWWRLKYRKVKNV